MKNINYNDDNAYLILRYFKNIYKLSGAIKEKVSLEIFLQHAVEFLERENKYGTR